MVIRPVMGNIASMIRLSCRSLVIGTIGEINCKSARISFMGFSVDLLSQLQLYPKSPILLPHFDEGIDHAMHFLPHTRFIPLLKAGMQTAAGSIPFLLQAFPLTARAQHIQDPIQHLPVGRRWSARPANRLFLRKQLLNLFPRRIRYIPERGITDLTLLAGCLVRSSTSASGVSIC